MGGGVHHLSIHYLVCPKKDFGDIPIKSDHSVLDLVFTDCKHITLMRIKLLYSLMSINFMEGILDIKHTESLYSQVL